VFDSKCKQFAYLVKLKFCYHSATL